LIKNYLNSYTKNKIIIHRDVLPEVNAVDIGFLLSQSIYNWSDESKLSMKVTSELEKILNDEVINHSSYGRIIAISNIGILLEPDLKQDLRAILENYSNNNTLFVKWDGEIDNDHLYFLSKEIGIKININKLSHIVI
jgi:hypothetical protein